MTLRVIIDSYTHGCNKMQNPARLQRQKPRGSQYRAKAQTKAADCRQREPQTCFYYMTPSICQGIRDLNQQYIMSAISSPTLTHLRFHRHADDDDDRATQRQTLQCFPVGSLWLVINFTVSRGFILGTTFSVHKL